MTDALRPGRVARLASLLPTTARQVAARLPGALAPPVESGTPTPRVAIVGTGFGGLGMAIRLKQAGIDTFTVYEKADAVGGTWRDNTYPGAACDVPSHLYSLSFAPKSDWTRKFPDQPEILDYLQGLPKRCGIEDHIRLGTELAEATYDERREEWHLRFVDGSTDTADVLVAATGQLNRPYTPAIEGRESFEGVQFHSARWPSQEPGDDGDLTGKDVAVVGIGASAIQFVPEVAKVAKSVTLYQRSSNFVAPKADGPIPEETRERLQRWPILQRLYRFSIWLKFEWRYVVMRRGSRLGAYGRKRFNQGLAPMVGDHLSEAALIPDYPLGCKRILISNDWYPTLLQPHVKVVTDRVERITPTGVVAGGEERAHDALVFGTGFQSTGFLTPMRVVGRGGESLHDRWADGAEAHLGMTVSGFPNLFILYGPNTNLGHNSIVFMLERQISYVLTCVRRLAEDGMAALDLRRDVEEASSRSMDRRLAKTVWAADCHSWYKTSTGRITNNWPGFTVEYWARTAWPKRRDYEAVPMPDRHGAAARREPVAAD